MKQISNIVLLAFTFIIALTSCDKTQMYEIKAVESVAHFNNKLAGRFDVLTTTSVYKVYIGVTAAADVDRNVSFTVTSPTGAVAGTHYTLDKTSATIRAGQVIDSITITGSLPFYVAGREDSLYFTINDQGGVKASTYNPTFRLYMRGPCLEKDIDLTKLRGTYANTIETIGTGAPYGPYTTTISAVSSTGPTTGTITVTNIFDYGWAPITFKLDWTNINKRTITLVEQSGIADASTVFGASWAGDDISVRPFGSQTGTFSYCNGTLQLKMDIGITGVGYLGELYTVNLAR